MKPIQVVLGPLAAADADGICQSQTPAGGGVQSLTINGALASGGVATMDIARRVLLTTAADETARTFTITGTDRYGNTQTESMAGVNATTAYTELDFKTVTSITVDDDTAGAITFGTNTIASSAWIPVDYYRNPINIGMRVDVSSGGSLDWSIQHTEEPVFNSQGPFLVAGHDTLVGQTTSAQGNYAYPIAAFRITLNSWTSGYVTMGATQAGLLGG